MTESLLQFPVTPGALTTPLTTQSYPFCVANLSTGHILRFLPDQPGYTEFMAALTTHGINIAEITTLEHLDILLDATAPSSAKIRSDIEFNTYSNEELVDLYGYRVDPTTGDFEFVTESVTYQDYKRAFSQVGLNIDNITSANELLHNAFRLRDQYKRIVTQRLLKKSILTEDDRFQLAVFSASTSDLAEMLGTLSNHFDNIVEHDDD